MDEDKFSMVEKIVKDIHNIMSKNAELCSFEVVPVDTNFRNKSPVLHIENCLGLESWCVKHVYMYCYSEIMNKFSSREKRKTLKLTSFMSDRLIRLLNVTLLLNPELSSLWNKRRELTLKLQLEMISELMFTKLVLSRKPKCNDAFSYRRWILDLILKEENIQSNYIESLINNDLSVCQMTANQSPNNYHSWNHRIWLVNKLQTLRQINKDTFYIKEYEFSEHWASKHVSDFSCFHYRQFCIKNIFTINNTSWKTFENTVNVNLRKTFVRVLATNFPGDVTIEASEDDLVSYSDENIVNLLLSYKVKNCDCITNNMLVCRKFEILFHELVLNDELLRFYKSHETLWYHRRFIVHEIISIMYDHFGFVRQCGTLVKANCSNCNIEDMRQRKSAKIGRYDPSRVYSSVLFNVLLSHERKVIEERRNDGDNYSDRHEKYLKFVEGLNNIM